MSKQDDKFRVVVLISGRGSNLQALHRSISASRAPIEIAAVLSDKKDAAGLEFAASCGIPTQVVPRLPKQRSNAEFNTVLADAVEQFRPDLIVLAGYMRVVAPEFIRRFPDRVINIHPALLPSFRGLHAQAQALAAGVRFAGATVHFVVEEVDAGPIIAQAVVPVLPGDDEEKLSARILRQEHILLPAVVQAVAAGAVQLVRNEAGDQVIVDSRCNTSTEEDSLVSIR